MEIQSARYLAETNFKKEIPIKWDGCKVGIVCGYHSKMNRIIVGLNSKTGWEWKCPDDGELISGGFKSYLYVEIEEI